MTQYKKRPGFPRELAGTGYIAETDAIKVQAENSSQFGEFIAASRTPIIELNSAYGTSALRDIVKLTGSASKDDINGSLDTGEISLSTGTTASSVACLASAEVARYIPGYSAEMGLGMRFPDVPTGDQAVRWGGRGLNENNGFYFLYDATGLAVVRKRDGTEFITRREDWNIDKLDGAGPSGVNLDLTSGNIFQIDYTWYGYGNIRFSILGTAGEFQRPIPIHRINNADFIGTSVKDPSMQVFSEVINGTTTSDYTAYVGGRQYSIIGSYVPKYRFTGETRSSVTISSTVTPLIGFNFKTAFQNRSIKLNGFNLVNTGANTARLLVLIDPATVTGQSYGTPTNYTAAETALESDIAATAITGGDVVWQGTLVPGGVGTTIGLGARDVDIDLPEASEIYLCAQTFSGTTTVESGFTMQEEW